MKDFTENFIFALFNVNNNSIHSESKLKIKNNRLVWGLLTKSLMRNCQVIKSATL